MTTPLRQQNIGNSAAARSGSPEAGSPGPYPMGPPMTEMTGVHAGTVLTANGKVSHGPLHPDDEREMVQLMYEMISYEQEIEKAKEKLAEQGDFNLMDAFQMFDSRNLGWITAP